MYQIWIHLNVLKKAFHESSIFEMHRVYCNIQIVRTMSSKYIEKDIPS